MFAILSRTSVVMAASAAITALGSAAFAHDFNPPPWERFTPYTTFQEWDFLEDNEEGPPDGTLPGNWFNEGKPGDTPNFELSGTAGWVASDDGTWYGTGNGASFSFFCPNWIDQEPVKWVWIQISGQWATAGGPGGPEVTSVTGQKGTTPVYPGQFVNSGGTPGSTLWELWELQPNPDNDWITISMPPGVYISQVVIDTISFPTPGAVAAFGIVGLGAMRRRR